MRTDLRFDLKANLSKSRLVHHKSDQLIISKYISNSFNFPQKLLLQKNIKDKILTCFLSRSRFEEIFIFKSLSRRRRVSRRVYRVNGIFARDAGEREREKESGGIRGDRKRTTTCRKGDDTQESTCLVLCRRYHYEESASRQCVSGTHVPFGLRFFFPLVESSTDLSEAPVAIVDASPSAHSDAKSITPLPFPSGKFV